MAVLVKRLFSSVTIEVIASEHLVEVELDKTDIPKASLSEPLEPHSSCPQILALVSQSPCFMEEVIVIIKVSIVHV